MQEIVLRQWNPRIEGLRGFSILLVFVFHLSNNHTHNWGALGVGIFFVISGYVITGSMSKEFVKASKPKLMVPRFLIEFYIRRGRRLLPLAILVILLSLFISLLDPLVDKKQYLLSALFCFFYIGNLFGFTFGYTDLAPALGHFWSLAVEEQFYLIWPVLFLLGVTKLRNINQFTRWIAIGIVTFALSHPLIAMAGITVWTLPTTYFDLLLLGCGMRLITNKIENIEGTMLKFIQFTGVFSLLAIILVEKFPANEFASFFQYNFNFFLVGILFVFALNSSFFEARILQFFGKISYSLYCIHAPLIVFCRSFFGDSILLMLFIAPVSVYLSYLSNRYFESRFYKPTQRV